MISPQIEMYLQSKLGRLLDLNMEEQEAIQLVEELFKSGFNYCKQQVKEIKLEGNPD